MSPRVLAYGLAGALLGGCGLSIVGAVCEGCAAFDAAPGLGDGDGADAAGENAQQVASRGPEAGAPREADAEPLADADASVPPAAFVYDGGSCAIDCTGGACAAAGEVKCPPGVFCRVVCDDTCPPVVCAPTRPCAIDCRGPGRCAGLRVGMSGAAQACLRCGAAGEACDVMLCSGGACTPVATLDGGCDDTCGVRRTACD